MKRLFVMIVTIAGILYLSMGAWGQNVTLSGTQTRGQGTDANLHCTPLSLPRGGVVVGVRCDCDGFWIEGPAGIIDFPVAARAMNYVLPPGEYKAFPKLKVNQNEAAIGLEIRPPGANPNPTGGNTTKAKESSGASVNVDPVLGQWRINSGGIMGTKDEKQIFYTGTLIIRSKGNSLEGTLNFGGTEILQSVSFTGSTLTFVRKTSTATQTYTGTVNGKKIVGSFVHKDARQTATQYWEAQKF